MWQENCIPYSQHQILQLSEQQPTLPTYRRSQIKIWTYTMANLARGIQVPSQNSRKKRDCQLHHICLSVHPHATTWLPLDGFSWNVILWFYGIYQNIPILVQLHTNNRCFIWRPTYILMSGHYSFSNLRQCSLCDISWVYRNSSKLCMINFKHWDSICKSPRLSHLKYVKLNANLLLRHTEILQCVLK
jgi:hypothetical protein